MVTVSMPKLLLRNLPFFSLMHIKMNGKNINSDDKKIKKSEFYRKKNAFQIDDVDVNKILISRKEPYGTKNALNPHMHKLGPRGSTHYIFGD